MSSPEYEESSGKLLETMLAAQKSVRDNMRTYLETMNVPTREDIARLGELVIGLEEKVDQLVDRLDAIEDAVRRRARGAGRARRTRPGPGRSEPTGANGSAGADRPKGAAGPKGAARTKGATGAAGQRGRDTPAARASRRRPPSPSKAAKRAVMSATPPRPGPTRRPSGHRPNARSRWREPSSARPTPPSA